MRVIQFREALREALSEEMRKDENIFLMGEEVAEYNGAYKVSLDVQYIDGTKIESASNRYTFVWRGSVEKHKEKLEQKINPTRGC